MTERRAATGMVPGRARAAVLLLLAFGVAVAATWLPTSTEYTARAVAWLVAAAAAVRATRNRGEPRSSWFVFGLGAVAVAASWLVRSGLAEPTRLGQWPDALSAGGLFLVGGGLLLAGTGRRERVALFDGALLAGAVLTFSWATLVAPQSAGDHAASVGLAAGFHVAGGALSLGVAGALALAHAGDRRRTRDAAAFTVAVVALTLAGIGWGWQGLQGAEQALAGAAGWVLAPLAAAVVAVSPALARQAVNARVATAARLTPARFAGLVILTILPALTVGILRAVPSMRDEPVPVTLGLWVTTAAVVILALRIRAVAGFALEDERQIAQERFSHLIEHSADVVGVLTTDGTIFYLSPSVRRVFGHDPEHLRGRNVREFLDDATDERLVHLLELARQGQGRPAPVRIDVVDADGLTRPAEGTIIDLCHVDAVGGLVITLRDISERVAMEAELKRAALEDPLTGLANRTVVHDRLRHAMAQYERGGPAVAVLYLDLDEFKQVNDVHGHAAGDRLLLAVAERLRACVREGDTAGRLGGDEFAVILEGLPREDPAPGARVVVDRLLASFADPVDVANEQLLIRASIGLTVGRAGQSPDQVLQDADMAMYTAKAALSPTSMVAGPDDLTAT